MKRLMNPKWILLVQNLTAEERSEVFMAILEYPDRACQIPVWPFIKSELDEDEKKYRAKCDRLAENRMARWQSEQTSSDINMNSTDFRQSASDIRMISGAKAIEHSKEQFQNNKTKHSNSKTVDALIAKVAGNFSPNRPVKYLINSEFSIAKVLEQNPGTYEFLKKIPTYKIMAAEESLINKCYGEEKTLKQIIGWTMNEGNFKDTNRA